MPKQERGGVGSSSGGGKPKKNLTYKEKSSIRFVQDDDPPFLRAMKEKMGYQEPKIDDKFSEQLDEDDERDPDDILTMKESDRPSVVVLDPKKDLTLDDLDDAVRRQIEEEDQRKLDEGRITFKKPTKRSNDDGDTKDEQSDEKRQKSEPQKANSKMLSFNDDEEEN